MKIKFTEPLNFTPDPLNACEPKEKKTLKNKKGSISVKYISKDYLAAMTDDS